MRQGLVFVIAGPSGVGKGTLIKELRRRVPELRLPPAVTTRPPRPGERDGSDYHFLSVPEFKRKVARGEFVEYAEYAGNLYGTPRQGLTRQVEAGSSVLLEIDLQGARQVRLAIPEAIQIFIAPPSLDALQERLVSRSTDRPEAIAARLHVAEQELVAQAEFDHVIVNDRLEVATDELVAVVRQQMSQQAAP